MELDTIECGDAYELIKSLPDKSIDLIVTDPPYQYSSSKWFQGGFKNEAEKAHCKNISERIEQDGLKDGIKTEMLDEWCRVLKKINIFIFCNKNQIIPYLDYFVTKKRCNWEMLIWAKTNPVPLANNAFVHDKEYCLRFQEKGATQHIHDCAKGKTIYCLPLNQKDGKAFGHPTIKPLAMVRNIIEIGTDKGGVVLDTFIGSGTTAVACQELGRHYIGFELNPKWAQVALERLKGITQTDKYPVEGYEQGFLL